MIEPEEIGHIVARMAIHDEAFLKGLILSASKAGDALLPEDATKLESWANFIRILRVALVASNIQKET